MEPFFYPSFYPRRFYHSEPQFSPNHWMPNMNPWYGGQPFDHSPYGHRRPFRYPVATRGAGRNDGRVWSNLFAQPPQRSRVASVRSPLLQLFGDDFFRSALADDIICLLEHHSQNPDEATTKTLEGRLITGEKKDSSTASKASSPDPSTQPSTSSTEPSKESSSSSNIKATKDSEKKESSDPCEGYMLRFELSPDGFYRPVYSPVPLPTLRRKQLLNDDFFKSVFTDDLVSLLEHHVKEADDAYRREAGKNETDTSSLSEGAVANKEADDEPVGKPFNVSLKLGDFNPENVNVSLDGRKVIVKAKQEEQGKDDSWKRHSHVEYSFLLPEETPAESLTSSFDKDGILSITAKTQDDETTNNVKAVKCSSEENVETDEQKTEETK